MTVTSRAANVSVEARNIGGIEHTHVEFEPGITILVGRNATNRTSFLQALMTALGSDRASLKADADEGEVTLSLGDETFTRVLRRKGSNTVADGDPYLSDPELADLFAFLLESNEARRAVERGDDLRELIMRPVDTTAIEAQITQLEAERRQIDTQLNEADALERTIGNLERREAELDNKIDDARERLESLEAEIEAAERTDDGENEALDRLNELRSTLENVRFRLETERQSLEALRDDETEIRDSLDELPDETADSPSELESKLSDRRERVRELESQMNEIQNIVRVNESMLAGENRGVTSALRGGSNGGSVTDQLLGDDDVVCWTCGSEVSSETIEATVEHLEEYRAKLASERREARNAIDELSSRLDTIEERRTRRRELSSRLEQTVAEREETLDRIDELESRQEELREEITTVEAEAEDVDDETDELVELHSEANRAELERERLENERGRVRDRLDEARTKKDKLAEYKARREEIGEEIRELRGRIDRIESEAVEAFNDHMERVLDILQYENIERVWIERIRKEASGRGQSKDQSEFNLHIVRQTESGTVYEDTVDHLSESEREVIGLVFGLAGYLVHDVAEQLPFMLLDSLEAIDSERIAALVEYVHEHAEFVVVALLPEDAAALDDQHARITEI
ncbi:MULTISPECIES: archaea-specific SMC-related protein [Haloferax]|uniref:AAA family ATPase n=1 Tax=Haloferax marinum TaxID=2666143 RepID=A0A6A8GBL4_9EURY|nr:MULTISPECIES: archaea-specific SMC-related protein [Haloferax]KAB1191252.1 AAA family ATPase [Haloferax sp. CBA1150]MRW98145.1 AAA family ATPase [Haloferax marinum]